MTFPTDGVDYLFTTTEMSLQLRSSSLCFSLSILPDDRLENSETLQLLLSTTDPNVIIGGPLSSTNITILNDDSEHRR